MLTPSWDRFPLRFSCRWQKRTRQGSQLSSDQTLRLESRRPGTIRRRSGAASRTPRRFMILKTANQPSQIKTRRCSPGSSWKVSLKIPIPTRKGRFAIVAIMSKASPAPSSRSNHNARGTSAVIIVGNHQVNARRRLQCFRKRQDRSHSVATRRSATHPRGGSGAGDGYARSPSGQTSRSPEPRREAESGGFRRASSRLSTVAQRS